ncbi:polyribonucleotide nucleotidyltransferase [Francisella adeliensis]|uniref:Polyribonucleotide nucleotidyltransferase n=1 Tax=Francisella adeliensis TaxID=2007306 RepID=A0A2Z4XZ36_9GAMM|nr:polyribonucleotide nucleotidyltransferase [Francisella adeliensis]AXA34024.1 polyribonucleotide nucleotidyltransferase [Francisella adeliensis]MBK2085184.1 polyribonucleotide nucleotidyltransferase [Francisella adeliensis]MBK2096048.1 polyribonucleotide nucleotidyltransferase [Francisella adeliensis]QIW12261.1 polyribonucleotide nucleotidyltransferase [Francisella adeliensis]QIW14136.1 polyribonucleotide nucleotidyltransferase [Francisella adeliensis]
MKIYKEVFELGDKEITIETGGMARQADGSVTVSCGSNVVLVTTVVKKSVAPGQDFFPLSVHYLEKTYAAGKIPGGFLRREGRPSEEQILISRLIDRSIRPSFPDGFFNEIQIVATVISYDGSFSPDMLALIGASASLALTGAPYEDIIAGVRVGFVNGKYTLNPNKEDLKESALDLVVSGTDDAILMVESEAKSLPESVMLGGILYAHKHLKTIISSITKLAKVAAKPAMEYTVYEINKILKAQIKSNFFGEIKHAYSFASKQERNVKLSELRKKVLEYVYTNDTDNHDYSEKEIVDAFHDIEKDLVRSNILEGSPRIDGRATDVIRPINVKTGVLPGVHGSALFTRGETQALVVTTLGSDRDAQMVESLDGMERSRYMLHYNFPPYSVGECGMVGMAPKRREIGHANLAKRATQAVFPNQDAYPYVVRIVSEILESNGSSSMATVCGSSLSMMDAGVPIAEPVAGIAMGLIKDGSKYAVLSDILGDEDHLGDMDFKVAGTRYGVTALQMDIKIKGISRDILEQALEQARSGRLHILGIMNEVIKEHKETVSNVAPQIHVMNIKPAKIKDVVGRGGSTVKGIAEKTGAQIDTSDTGEVKIFARDKASLDMAVMMVEEVVAEAEEGQVYKGKIVKILDSGAFVNLFGKQDGYLPFADVEQAGIKTNSLSEGQPLEVVVQAVDRMGRVKVGIVKR